MLPPSAAMAATWLLVRMSPSEVKTMPLPEPAAEAEETLILTTDGSTAAATDSTLCVPLLEVLLVSTTGAVRASRTWLVESSERAE